MAELCRAWQNLSAWLAYGPAWCSQEEAEKDKNAALAAGYLTKASGVFYMDGFFPQIVWPH